MAILSADLQLPVYEFESTSGAQFGVVTLSIIDVNDPNAFAQSVRGLLEALPGVDAVSVKRVERVETVI